MSTGSGSITQTAAAGALEAVKLYGEGDTEIRALDGVTVTFERSRFTAIMGPSGSGKSTLMHCLAGLDRLSSGRTFIGDTYLDELGDAQLTELRRDKIGFIFQAFNLIPTLSALENITLPMDLAGRKPDAEWMDQVIDTVGLRPRLSHRPSELSGGQQQRVAVARALVTEPAMILADEPTGNLDSTSTTDVLGLFDELHAEGRTIVLITHELDVAARADRIVEIHDGRLSTDSDTDVRRTAGASR